MENRAEELFYISVKKLVMGHLCDRCRAGRPDVEFLCSLVRLLRKDRMESQLHVTIDFPCDENVFICSSSVVLLSVFNAFICLWLLLLA